jgi:4-alpha-glucanotransferase
MQGTWHETSRETRAAILAAMGVGSSDGSPDPAPIRVVRQGEPQALSGPAELTLEDGTALRVDGSVPPDVPLGYHALRFLADGKTARLIVSPGCCFLPASLRTWGWALQLYALRSAASWGIGDLGDLRALARWSAVELGAGFLLVNPLVAATPTMPQQASPYSPSSRRYLNPLYLRIEEVPGATQAGLDLETLATAGRALNGARRIDRDAVFRLKTAALEGLWARFPGDPAFERYRADQGNGLRQFAIFCALAESHGPNWRAWPAEFRHPDAPAVARFAGAQGGRVRFHEWLQWLLDVQFARAAAEIRLMQDLPVGVHPDGADAWAWQDVLAQGVSVGAPPDSFNTQGQDWGLPPFVPHKLRAASYEPFVQTLRAAMRHAGGLRIDHIMGFFRLFWVPWGTPPVHGAYVRYPVRELLAILALESQRAGAVIVGEDLGTVEPGVREELAARQVLSIRLVWFEPEPPARYPRLALSAVTTHDLPTIAGLWSGTDLQEQYAVGLRPNEAGTRALRARLGRLTGLPEDADLGEVVLRTHRLLAQAPSMLITATLEDALAIPERPNMPGTSTERQNWSLALPVPLEAIQAHSLPRAVAEVLARGDGA